YSEQKEQVILPGKGLRLGLKIIKGIFNHTNKSYKTDLSGMFYFALHVIKKTSNIIAISDCIDEVYDKLFMSLAEKHDLVAIQLTDPLESALPSLGIIPIYDKEEGKTTWVNTAFGGFSKKIAETFVSERESLKEICKKNQINHLLIDTKEDIVL